MLVERLYLSARRIRLQTLFIDFTQQLNARDTYNIYLVKMSSGLTSLRVADGLNLLENDRSSSEPKLARCGAITLAVTSQVHQCRVAITIP